jgi:excisionase family DNA binding protein
MIDTTLAFTIADAAKASGLGRTSLYELIGAGKLEARKAGNRTLIPADSLRAYLASLPAADIRTGQRRTVA